MRTRIISKIEIKSDQVVKPIFFEGLKKIGNPKDIIKSHLKQNIDEIIIIDIVASLYQRQINFNLLNKITNNVNIPITLGGGIKTIKDISKLLKIGADKIAVNTSFLNRDVNLLNQSSKLFGSQCIVVDINSKFIDGDWYCMTDNGRINSKKKVVDWIIECQDRGAGEILLQSIDVDGSMNGPDIKLLDKVEKHIEIPLIIASGIGSYQHIYKLKKYNPDAICISSALHYKKLNINNIKKNLI